MSLLSIYRCVSNPASSTPIDVKLFDQWRQELSKECSIRVPGFKTISWGLSLCCSSSLMSRRLHIAPFMRRCPFFQTDSTTMMRHSADARQCCSMTNLGNLPLLGQPLCPWSIHLAAVRPLYLLPLWLHRLLRELTI